jgi:hypothetical protein
VPKPLPKADEYTQNPYQTDTIVRGKLFHFVESLKVVHEIVLLNACAILWRVYEVAWMQRRKSTRLRTGSSFKSCQNGFEFPNSCVQSPAVFWWCWDQIEGTRDFRTNLTSKL